MAIAVSPFKDKLLTVKELATYLNCHTSTVYRMIKSGELPCFKLGSDWRFSLKAIDEWIRDNTARLNMR